MHADLYTACVHSVRGEAIDKKCDLTADYSVSDARISIGAGRYRYATVRTVKNIAVFDTTVDVRPLIASK